MQSDGSRRSRTGPAFRAPGAGSAGVGYRRFVWILIGSIPLGLPACAAPKPSTVDSNRTLDGDDGLERRRLSAAEQSDIERVFRDLARGHEPVGRVAVPDGLVWSDLAASVTAALTRIEAVRRRTVEDRPDHRAVFAVETLDGAPGEVVIARRDDTPPDGPWTWDDFEVTATLGRFPAAPRRVAQADEFRAALRQAWEAAAGRKRWIAPAD